MGATPPRSFTDLYREHKKYVWRFTCRMGVLFDDIPDVAQNVFTALHEAMESRGLDTGASIKPWLRAVTFRTARDHLEHAHRAREVLSSEGAIEVADAAPNPEERMVTIDVHRFVGRVMSELPHELHLVLVMSEIEEMTREEIAAELRLPEGTVASRLRAARRAFEAAFNQQRAAGNAAVMPFALWGVDDLLHAARATPDVPEQAMDEVWRRLVSSIPSLGAGAAVAAIPAAAAAKVGAVITAKQAVLGTAAALFVGAGLHALLGPALGGRSATEEIAVAHDQAPVAVVTASVTSAEPVAPVAVVPSASALADAGAAAPAGDGMDRTWLKNARDAYERGDYEAARRALARVKGSHLAPEREELRRLLPPAGQDGGTR
jgi:RNA polymerase sigma-70 factor (ECF subfamily)